MRRFLNIALLVLLGAACWKLAGTAINKQFTIDEFHFTHGGWQIAHGKLPYRDFIVHNAPLSFYIFAAPWLFLNSDPANIIVERWFCLAAAFISLALVWRITDRSRWGAVVILLLAVGTPFSHHGIEIRRDNLALPLFLAAVSAVQSKRLGSRERGIIIGILYGLLLWTNEKMLYVALPFPALALASWINPIEQPIGRPKAFFAAAAAVCLTGIALLAGSGNLLSWFQWFVLFSINHEWVYSGPVWLDYFAEFFSECWWLLILAAFGVANTLKRAAGDFESADLLLLLLLPSSLAGFVLLSGPFPYSLMPFQVICSIFAGRAVIELAPKVLNFRAPSGYGRTAAAVFFTLLIVAVSFHVRVDLYRRTRKTNQLQFSVLQTVAKLSLPTDCVFDSSGSSVSRPPASKYYSTDAAMRKVLKKEIEADLLRGLEERDCMLMLYDARMDLLTPAVRQYLMENFVPYNGNVGVRGRRFDTSGGKAAGELSIPSTGRYFVYGLNGDELNSLTIDGAKVAGSEFELTAGRHVVDYSGPPAKFSIIWLPRDGQRFEPRKDYSPGFSVIL